MKSCYFGEMEDTILRTQVILGIRIKDLQARLLRFPLTMVIKYCQAVNQAEAGCGLFPNENLSVD